MSFLELLNESSVTFVTDLGKYWSDPALKGVSGYEAVSPGGEIRVFSNYADANAWRLAEIKGIA